MSDPRPQNPEDAIRQMRKRVADAVHANRGLYIFIGLAICALGVAAIAFPHVSTLAATVFTGWLFIIGGIAQGAHAFSLKGVGAMLLGSLLALLALAAGILIVMHPLEGALTLTIVLVCFFLTDGVLRVIAAFRFKPLKGWGMVALTGVVSILMAALLLSMLPAAADWVIGLMVGINFLMWGITLVMLANAAKNLSNND